jgi:hypothetical protein
MLLGGWAIARGFTSPRRFRHWDAGLAGSVVGQNVEITERVDRLLDSIPTRGLVFGAIGGARPVV